MPTSDDTAAIRAENLTRMFGSFTAVDAISLSVAPGEVFGFLGANGAGKTTAIKMFTGLLAPTNGTAYTAGFNVSEAPEKVKQCIGYMSQRFALYDDLTVRENVQFYAGIYGLPDDEIEARMRAMLERLDFMHGLNERVGRLPLGWKQKLAFSVALLHEPDIVFLDEPTGGVDPVTRRQFWEMIYAAAADDTTVFVTTHYMDEAEYCDRVSIMVDGRIAALGTPEALKHEYDVSTMDEVFVHVARSDDSSSQPSSADTPSGDDSSADASPSA